jgi:hypothetical protein
LIAKFKPAKNNNALEISGEDLSFLKGKLFEIKETCMTFDNDTAEAALNDLRQKEWPNYVETALDDIATHILHSDFDKAADMAENTAMKINV